MKKAAFLAVFVLAGCASMQSSDADSGMTAHRNEFMRAARAGDAAALAAGYADDAILMPPNAPAQRGAAAIQQFWAGFMSLGKIDAVLTPEKVVSSGDLASEAGKYDLTITPKSGAPIHDVGKYVVTAKRIGGQWKLVMDIFNSDQPSR
jgi:ketosteroid isomerase-like protein